MPSDLQLERQVPKQSRWVSLIQKEDWWTVWIGLF